MTMKKVGLLLIIVLLFSCSSEDEGIDYNKDEEFYHVLVLGNSLSRDAFSYVPAVMENVFPGLSINIDILCLNGKSLAYHWDYLSNNLSRFEMDVYTTKTGRWRTFYGVSGNDVISSKKWDIIVMQEGTTTIKNYSKTQTHIENISNYIRAQQTTTLFAFLLHPSCSKSLKTSDELWTLNTNTASELLRNNEINYVIPCGTGIQNARHTSLGALGEKGNMTYDGVHLQEGTPCLMDAYVAAQSLFDILSIDASIKDSQLQITQQWVNNKNIPGQHGSVITGTDEDYELCKKCALLAIENPYEISLNP